MGEDWRSYLLEKVKRAPQKPGCYIWYGENKEVLYVGKASILRNRLRKYYHQSRDYKTQFLMGKVKDLDWIVTNDDLEALLLENNLIKKYQPRYNIRLKDDKKYPYICISWGEPFPRVFLTRNKKNKEHIYYGPFTDVYSAKRTLKLLDKLFPYRKRGIRLPAKKPLKPCINYHMGRCLAPCAGYISQEEYRKILLRVKDFLEGNVEDLIKNLKNEMEEYSKKWEFEKAKKIRDLLFHIQNTLYHAKQDISQEEESLNYDVLAPVSFSYEEVLAEVKEKNLPSFLLPSFYRRGGILLLKVRRGNVVSKGLFSLGEIGEASSQEMLEAFFRDYYMGGVEIPPKIYVLEKFSSSKWERFFEERKGKRVEISYASSYEGIFKMAWENAYLSLREEILHEIERSKRWALLQIKQIFHLDRLPLYIECFDISHIQGKFAVGSRVVFKEGIPCKSLYRRYKIRSFTTVNDPGMMYEVLSRRFRAIHEGKEEKPDFILLDGGIPQLQAALQALKEHGFSFPMAALAKKEEKIYLPSGRVLSLEKESPAMLLLRKIRDEAHRFAISYFRHRLLKGEIQSFLRSLKGIGEKKEEKILKILREKEKKEEIFEEIQKIPLPKDQRESLYAFLKEYVLV